MSVANSEPRWTLVASGPPISNGALAGELEDGLKAGSKRLPCRYLYDETGSQIFDEICELPEYYLTRAEHSILDKRADEIVEAVPESCTLVELGSGSAMKTRTLMEAFLTRQEQLTFVPIDISQSALEESAGDLLESYPALDIYAIAGDYESGLEHLGELDSRAHLIAWLGSSVGNLGRDEAVQFLEAVRSRMRSRDRMLLGVDLRKDAETLEQAYDDAQGVTERFNLNLLERINRELGGHFDTSQFRFEAIYREEEGVVQSYLVSERTQEVRVDAFDTEIRFEAGERIHTEDSFKYSEQEIDELCRAAGFEQSASWLDAGNRFNLSLLAPAD